MRLNCLLAFLAFWAPPLMADEKVNRLADAMHLSQVMDILVDEAMVQRRELDETLLDNTGGAFFEAQVEDIYDPIWMQERVTEAFERGLTDSQLDQAIVFFESDLGQTIISLENSARRAISDDAIEEMAREAYENTARDSVRYELVNEYIEINNLIEQNVEGSLSADFNFFRGLAYGELSDEGELLAELLSETDSKTEEATTWLYSFLLLAYRPMDETQMRENIAFSRTDTGQAVNEALFDGFDQMFDSISFRLGEAAAQVLRGSDI
ncbi:DUF2059 domain-containing protein [Ruegeria sp. EL01]|uniref:DUF2059 domain-containing protein n=1 Tax=Ruegeria sp. EL01 TaxID=2107578 RepID=UPI000EA82854|nr:DUF2059 domain-containing protein [Ruegeria sp. EL01]